MSELLRLEGLSCGYGAPLFRDLSLTVDRGEILCLMGPNGCGKSTLLNTVLGLQRPLAGRVLLEGRDVKACSRREIARVLALVPQRHQPMFPYTVRQVVLMGRTAHLSLFSGPTEADEAMCDAALEQVGLLHLAETPYHQLSGGELQLVLLARAVGQQTPLLLLDEPTAHLDLRNELLFLETVSRLVRERHIGVLMATHDPDHAFYLEEEGLKVTAALIANGGLFAAGPPAETLTPPTLAQVYGVEAAVLEGRVPGQPTLRRIAPRHIL